MKKLSIKALIGWLICLVWRLLPGRAPNLEPILALQMPYAKRYGGLAAFVFGFLSILMYDILTAKVGVWTWITAFVYALLGPLASWYFATKKASSWNFIRFSVLATIFYDAATGLTIGPMFNNQPFIGALIGQIPFSILHLMGNVVLAAVLSPLVYKWIALEKEVSREVIPSLSPSLPISAKTKNLS